MTITKKDLEDYQASVEASNQKVTLVQKEVAEQLRSITQQLVLLAKSNEEILSTLFNLVLKPLTDTVKDHHSRNESLVKDKFSVLEKTMEHVDSKLNTLEKENIAKKANYVLIINMVVALLTLTTVIVTNVLK